MDRIRKPGNVLLREGVLWNIAPPIQRTHHANQFIPPLFVAGERGLEAARILHGPIGEGFIEPVDLLLGRAQFLTKLPGLKQ